MKHRQMIALLMALSMLLAVLSACGSTGASSKTEVESTEDSAFAAEISAEASNDEAAEPPESTGFEAVEEEESELSEEPEILEEPEEPYFPLADTKEISIWTYFPADMAPYADSVDEYHCVKNTEDALNVDLVITGVSDREIDTLFPLMLATGDYSDIMMFGKYTGSIETAVDEGILLDCTDYIDDYAPDYKQIVESDPVSFASFTTDENRYYGFWGIYAEGAPVQSGLVTRGDWMKEAGVDQVPTTIDGLETYLTALRDVGHSNALWMDSNGAYYTNTLSAAFGVSTGWGCNSFVLDDGKVVCSGLQPGMKDYIETMSRWYANDLIDKDFATNFAVYMTDMGDVLSGKVGIWMDVGDRLPAIVDQIDPGDGSLDLRAIPYPTLREGEENHYVLVREHNMGSLAYWGINAGVADPELAIRFINFGFTDEGYTLYNWGLEGDSYTVAPDGTKVFSDEVLSFPLGLSRGLEMYAKSFLPYNYDYAIDEVKNAGCEEEVNTWSSTAGDGTGLISLNNMTTEESDIVNGTTANDYATYFKECSLKFMTGEMSLERDWDSFVANIEAMNVQPICDAYQAAFDRMQNKVGR